MICIEATCSFLSFVVYGLSHGPEEPVQIDMRDSESRRPFPKFPVSVKMA